MTLGLKVGEFSELYLRGEYYDQSGNGHPAQAIGQLAQQNLFGAVKAANLMAGFKFGF